jgi:hypothetical protein
LADRLRCGQALVNDHPGPSNVEAWVKNDHLGFEIVAVFDGVVRKYRPDFVVRLRTGTPLVLGIKGQDSPQNQAKRAGTGFAQRTRDCPRSVARPTPLGNRQQPSQAS